MAFLRGGVQAQIFFSLADGHGDDLLGADEKAGTVGFVQDILPAVLLFAVEIVALEIEFVLFLAEDAADLGDDVFAQEFVEAVQQEQGRGCFFRLRCG